MNNKIFSLMEFVHGILQTLFASSLLLCLFQMDERTPVHYTSILWVPIYITASYLIQAYINSLFLQITCLLASGLVVYPFCYSLPSACFNIIVAVILFIFGIAARKEREGASLICLPSWLVILFLPFSLFSAYYGNRTLFVINIIMALLYLITSYFKSFLLGLYKYTIQNQNSSNVSISRIIKTNSVMFLLFIALFLCCTGAIFFAPIEEIVDFLYQNIVDIIKWPLRLLLYFLATRTPFDTTIFELTPETMPAPIVPEVFTTLWDILQFALKLIVYYFICKFIISAINLLYRFILSKTSPEHDTITFTSPKLKNDIHREKNKKKSSSYAMSGREGQIRKCFIRLVSAHRYTKKHIFTSATINNICESMNIEEKNNGITPRDYSDVSELYKKARYSNEPATFKDVSYMKKECQKRFKRN